MTILCTASTGSGYDRRWFQVKRLWVVSAAASSLKLADRDCAYDHSCNTFISDFLHRASAFQWQTNSTFQWQTVRLASNSD